MLDEFSLKEGDVVLLEELDSLRNYWLIVCVIRIFFFVGYVCEVEVCVVRGDIVFYYVRLIYKFVLLVLFWLYYVSVVWYILLFC